MGPKSFRKNWYSARESIMKNIEQTYTLPAHVTEVWKALTDANIMDRWGASPAKFDAREGGKFSLWGGEVGGVTTKLIPDHLIEQDWYSSDPHKLYKVSFTLSKQTETTTKVELKHEGVEDAD